MNLRHVAICMLGHLTAYTSPHMSTFIEAGVIPMLINLLKSKDTLESSMTAGMSAWTLGNIAGHGSPMREEILKHNIIETLTDISNRKRMNEYLHINIYRLFMALCFENDQLLSKDKIKTLMSFLGKFGYYLDDRVCSKTFYIYFYFLGKKPYIQTNPIQM